MSLDVNCPNHPESHMIEDHRAGDLICSECGLVVGDRVIDVGTEWRSFNNEKSCSDPSRVGAPENPLLSGSDLSTGIDMTAGDADAIGLSNANRRQMNNSDRQLLQAFGIIKEMCSRINMVQSIQDQANKIFKDVQETKALRGKNCEAVAAACLYIACRKEQVPRSFKEICAVAKVNKKEIGRCFKLIIKALETNLEQITSADFMSRFCSNLDLSHKIQQTATHIARKAVDLNLVSGRSPISIAAAAIYMASQATIKDKRTAAEIGEIAGAAEVTVKTTYRYMRPRAPDLFPGDHVAEIPFLQLPPT